MFPTHYVHIFGSETLNVSRTLLTERNTCSNSTEFLSSCYKMFVFYVPNFTEFHCSVIPVFNL